MCVKLKGSESEQVDALLGSSCLASENSKLWSTVCLTGNCFGSGGCSLVIEVIDLEGHNHGKEEPFQNTITFPHLFVFASRELGIPCPPFFYPS